MCFLYFIITCAICNFGQLKEVESADTTLYNDLNLDYFTTFAQSSTAEIIVNSQTELLQLGVRPSASDGKCPALTIYVYLQYGSIPVFSLTDKTFPMDGYYVHRTGLINLTLHSDGPGVIYNLTLPKQGSWFLSAYVEKPTDKKIKKKSDGCGYFLGLSTRAEFPSATQDLHKHQTLLLPAQERKYLRFWLNSRVWMYKLTVSIATALNKSESHVEISGQALNQSEGLLTEACNLTANQKCVFERHSPHVEEWTLVMIENKDNSSVQIDVSLELSECANLPDSVIVHNENYSDIDSNSNESDRLDETKPQTDHMTTIGLSSVSLKQTDNSSAQNNSHGDHILSVVTKTPGRTTIRSDRAPPLQTRPVNHSLTPWKPLDTEAGPTICLSPISLIRKQNPADQFNTRFYGVKDFLPAWDVDILVFRLDILSLTDIGANLNVQFILSPPHQNDTFTSVQITLCIQKWGLPVNGSRLHCQDRDRIVLRSSDKEDRISRLYPYPEAGAWFIALQASCNKTVNNTGIPVSCGRRMGVGFRTVIGGCVNCNNDGYCTSVSAASRTMAYCHCRARYAGYNCLDDSHISPLTTQKTYTLLLTCSNLFFIPGIILAIYRRYYPEALVYFANMFFSAFYHACDMSGWSVYRMCILPYHVLSYCDFFLSIMSFWVTFIAVADPPQTAKSVCHMLGAIALAMAVEWHTHGLLTNLIPICIGGGVVIISWIVRCIRYRKCYPQKKNFLLLVPGVLLAGGGIATFELTETDDNYPYTHSMWHMCISLSICFLLPLRRQANNCTDTSSVSSENIELHPDLESRSDVPLLNPASAINAYCDDSDDDPKLDL